MIIFMIHDVGAAEFTFVRVKEIIQHIINTMRPSRGIEEPEVFVSREVESQREKSRREGREA